MTSTTDPSLLAVIALPIRLLVAAATLWCGALLALAFAQRSDPRDARVQRSWLLTASAIVGAAFWAGHLCVAIAIDGVPTLPLAGGLLSLLLAAASVAS